MGKHSGGDGNTMKNAGNWLGNSKKDTEEFEQPKDKGKGPEHKDIIKDEEKGKR